MVKNLEKQVKSLSVDNQVNKDFYGNSVEKIVGKKGEDHKLPNKTSFVVTR